MATILALFGLITYSVFCDGLKDTEMPAHIIENYITYSAIFYFIVVIAVVAFLCLYPVYKKSLRKVFFEPYKEIKLTPTIDRISCGIVMRYFALSLLFNLPAIVYE